MGIRSLKKVVLISDDKTPSDMQKLLSHIQNSGMLLQIQPWEEAIHKEEGTLYITDQSDIAAKMAANDFPVLGCLTRRNQNAYFGGVRYLTDAEEGLEPEYMERVYRRYHNIPWEILKTERCLVRETTEGDLDAFYEIYADPSITRYMENLFPKREDERQYITSYRKNVYAFYEYGIWSVLSRQTNQVIGRAGLTMREGFTEPELGFVIGISWQGKGYAYEVCDAILSYGRKKLGFQKVQAFTRPHNKASLGLLYKLGFEPKGMYEIEGIEHIRMELRMVNIEDSKV